MFCKKKGIRQKTGKRVRDSKTLSLGICVLQKVKNHWTRESNLRNENNAHKIFDKIWLKSLIISDTIFLQNLFTVNNLIINLKICV